MVSKIDIVPNKTIESLQNEFNRMFPYLRIEFFKEPHITGEGSTLNKMIQANARLFDIQKIKKNGRISIRDNNSVSDLERTFEKKFGLYIQVFRKSGNVWLETSATDGWTLAQQNEEGEMLAKHFKIEKENPEDHDMY